MRVFFDRVVSKQDKYSLKHYTCRFCYRYVSKKIPCVTEIERKKSIQFFNKPTQHKCMSLDICTSSCGGRPAWRATY